MKAFESTDRGVNNAQRDDSMTTSAQVATAAAGLYSCLVIRLNPLLVLNIQPVLKSDAQMDC